MEYQLKAERDAWRREHTFGGYLWPGGEPVEPEIDEVKVLLVTGGYGRTEIELTPAERREAVRRLHAQRYDDRQIADFLRLKPDTVAGIRRDLDLAAWTRYERIAA